MKPKEMFWDFLGFGAVLLLSWGILEVLFAFLEKLRE